MNQFPHYQQWVEVLNQRDTGVLFIAIAVANIWQTVVDIRFKHPRYLKLARRLLFALWVGSFVYFFAIGIR